MNKTKRNLELAGAIVQIVITSVMALIYFFAFLASIVMKDVIVEMLQAEDMALDAAMMDMVLSILPIVCFLFVAYMVALIIISANLCRTPVKYGYIKNRTGLLVTFLVLSGIMVLSTITTPDSFFEGILLAVPFALVLASACMKHPNKTIHEGNNPEEFYQNHEGQ